MTPLCPNWDRQGGGSASSGHPLQKNLALHRAQDSQPVRNASEAVIFEGPYECLPFYGRAGFVRGEILWKGAESAQSGILC